MTFSYKEYYENISSNKQTIVQNYVVFS